VDDSVNMFLRSLLKTAELRPKFQPYPHQQKAVDKFTNSGQLILAHATGTGKTATALFSVEAAKAKGMAKRAVVVVPSGLKSNFAHGGVKKFTTASFQIIGSKSESRKSDKDEIVYLDSIQPGKDYTIISYEMFLKDPVGILKRAGADTLLFDEFHKVRNERAKIHQAALGARQYARNFIGMTASPVNNNPAEIGTLVNIATNGQFMGASRFKRRYMRQTGYTPSFFGGKKKQVTMVRRPEAAAYIKPVVDYQPKESIKDLFPKKDVKTVKVPMSKEQRMYYDYVMRQLGPLSDIVAQRKTDLTPKQLQHVFGRIIHARRAMNDLSAINPKITKRTAAQQTPKVQKMMADLDDHMQRTPDGKVVIYSNLITGGLDVAAEALKQKGLKFGVFAGSGREVGGQVSSHKARAKAVKDFQAGKSKILLISGAGAEGLDLKNATGFFSMDGHWNPERILQAEARAVRMKGQAHRPQEARKVEVYRYQSVYPKKFFGKPKATVDQWIYDVAKRKHILNKQLRKGVLALPSPKRMHKYERKWRDPATGEWRYKYPDKPGFKRPGIAPAKKPRGFKQWLKNIGSKLRRQPSSPSSPQPHQKGLVQRPQVSKSRVPGPVPKPRPHPYQT